jgi:hypothetical protein
MSNSSSRNTGVLSTTLQTFYAQFRAEGLLTEVLARPGEDQPIRQLVKELRYATSSGQEKLTPVVTSGGSETEDQPEEVYLATASSPTRLRCRWRPLAMA